MHGAFYTLLSQYIHIKCNFDTIESAYLKDIKQI